MASLELTHHPRHYCARPPHSRFPDIGPLPGQPIVLDRAEIVVGRHGADELSWSFPDAQTLHIPHLTINRQHALFRRLGHALVIEDLKSRNGTYVNGQRVEGSVMLQHGDEIRLADFVFVFHSVGVEDWDRIWDRIEAWLQAQAPSIAASFNLPASPQEINATERFLGMSFPQDGWRLYHRHDGQAAGALGLLEGWEWLSLERMRSEWGIWKELLDAGTFQGWQSHTDGRVVTDWWQPGWIPLTFSGSGDHHCVDLKPGPRGIAGQIIELWHDQAARPVLAPNLREWFAGFADDLERGDFIVSEEYGGLCRRSRL
jgi:cell wall assembly regulator SMI1